MDIASGDDCPLGVASCPHCSHFVQCHSVHGANLGSATAESASAAAAADAHAQQDHRVVFFAHGAHPSWLRGTRSQTIVIRTRRRQSGNDESDALDGAGGAVYFLYRNLDRELGSVWQYRRLEA